MKRALIPSHNITIDPRYSLDLTIKFLQGVLTLLVGGVAQAFHDDRVVELRVQLGVEEVEGKDREEQVEVEK